MTMPATSEEYRGHLHRLITAALADNDPSALEAYMGGQSSLPGPRMNLALVAAFAEVVGTIVAQPDPPVARLAPLLDQWVGLPLAAAPVNDPREILPAAAVLAYGQVAVARPDWWGDEITKLHQAADSPRWRTREMVAAALQRMLAADWARAFGALVGWLTHDDPLVVRAAVTAVAEPALLKDPQHAEQALMIQSGAVDWLAALSPEERLAEPARVLRQALGYTVSVAVAAAPEPGLAWLDQLAASPDPDVQWIVRENAKKDRLKRLRG